ncbi:MAG TPA: YbhB/YbcL family Raf kinase inhibitor-like protein [Nitrospiraceae bacterium]|nr:YbhB/YbcL family Raf kinase inhibitor-like protein [Nitrospiraceae bacterium]
MKLQSPAFRQGDPIPAKYTCDGMDVSPPLTWTDPPQGIRSLALVADDPDAPRGTWVHWVAWNIPADTRSLPEALPKQHSLQTGMKQGTTDFKKIGYGGPCPPSGTHRYFFKLYALDLAFDLPGNTTKAELEKAMNGHTLQQAELMGTYQRT